MKNMVDQLVYEVRSDNRPRSISSADKPIETKIKKANVSASFVAGHTCPKCKQGILKKGTKAFGCSQFKEGCDFLLPFTFMEKKISEKQYIRLVNKGETVLLKGFNQNGQKVNGKLKLTDDSQVSFIEKKEKQEKQDVQKELVCPKCQKGIVLKGSKAYGCSDFKNGCDFIFPFDKLRNLAADKKLTKELVYNIISDKANWTS